MGVGARWRVDDATAMVQVNIWASLEANSLCNFLLPTPEYWSSVFLYQDMQPMRNVYIL